MYWPDLHRLIDWLTHACDFVLFALTKYFPIVIVIIALVVLAVTSGGGLLPGCGGPTLEPPTPSPTARPTAAPATVTATVPAPATPEPTLEPTPTMPESPASPLQTPPWV